MVEIKIYNQCGSESNLWAIWEGEHFLATAEAVHWYREVNTAFGIKRQDVGYLFCQCYSR